MSSNTGSIYICRPGMAALFFSAKSCNKEPIVLKGTRESTDMPSLDSEGSKTREEKSQNRRWKGR